MGGDFLGRQLDPLHTFLYSKAPASGDLRAAKTETEMGVGHERAVKAVYGGQRWGCGTSGANASEVLVGLGRGKKKQRPVSMVWRPGMVRNWDTLVTHLSGRFSRKSFKWYRV